MPRVRAPPSATVSNPSPFKSPVKIPLNDDREEKAKRLQSRQAMHESQMNSIRAAVTPMKKRKSIGPDGQAHTPQRGPPIMANFDEWMKMATDNKINATNSWNFALIDYFHDMSVLKEGDSVNFQRASCTLDGCVKIYTSRVDSVATETGKLLSGLADSGNKKSKDDRDDGEAGEDDEEEGEDGAKKKTKKKATRSAEATLATSFAQLQLKKMELEFAVDPLFKKASADFDEGGAKGLLLNHLCIDNTGRIVFDSSDDARAELSEDNRRDNTNMEEEDQTTDKITSEYEIDPTSVDIAGLAARFFPNLSILDSQDICPSMKTFELGNDGAGLDLPFLKAAEDWKKEQAEKANELDDARSGIVLDDDNAIGFDDDLDGFDLPPDTGFGEGGEAWAREANILPQIRPHNMGQTGADNDAIDADIEGEGEVGGFDSNGKQYGVTLVHRQQDEQDNILSYFDTAMTRNWQGPEHWKIKRIKDQARPTNTSTAAGGASKRKEKEPFEIDFLAPMTQAMADALYTPATTNSSISLPKAQWRSKNRNLLPDDKHFNSRSLLTLYLKPKARIGARKQDISSSRRNGDAQIENNNMGDVDEVYWAQEGNMAPLVLGPDPSPEDVLGGDLAGAGADYDANFFQDDGGNHPGAGDDDDDDRDFADANEILVPAADLMGGGNILENGNGDGQAAFGSQLVMHSKRLRPDYVQYARVAKKVDVRRLKEEMWKGIGFEVRYPRSLVIYWTY